MIKIIKRKRGTDEKKEKIQQIFNPKNPCDSCHYFADFGNPKWNLSFQKQKPNQANSFTIQ